MVLSFSRIPRCRPTFKTRPTEVYMLMIELYGLLNFFYLKLKIAVLLFQ